MSTPCTVVMQIKEHKRTSQHILNIHEFIYQVRWLNQSYFTPIFIQWVKTYTVLSSLFSNYLMKTLHTLHTAGTPKNRLKWTEYTCYLANDTQKLNEKSTQMFLIHLKTSVLFFCISCILFLYFTEWFLKIKFFNRY